MVSTTLPPELAVLLATSGPRPVDNPTALLRPAQPRGNQPVRPAERDDLSSPRSVADRSSLVELRLDKATTDGVAGQLDSVAHAELIENVLPVALDSLDTDDELLGDLFRRVGFGDQL